PGVRGLALSAPAAATAGTPFTVTVTAVDGQGAPVTSYDGTVHFTSSDTSPGVVLPPDSTLSSGTGTFSITLAGTGSQTVTVSDAARSLSATATVTVSSAARAEQLRTSGPATAKAGDAFSVTVSAVDGQGNPVPSYAGTIHFTSSDTAAAVRLPPDSTLSGGQATFNVTLTTAGAQTVTASDVASSLPSATASLAVGARAADHLALATSASPASGSSFPFTVTAPDGDRRSGVQRDRGRRGCAARPGDRLRRDSPLREQRHVAGRVTPSGLHAHERTGDFHREADEGRTADTDCFVRGQRGHDHDQR